MKTTTQDSPKVAKYPCDICGKQIKPGERFHEDENQTEHTQCTADWFRRNYGREGLS